MSGKGASPDSICPTPVAPATSTDTALVIMSAQLSLVLMYLAIETTIERDKMGGSVSLPLPLIVLCGGFPRKFVSDLESAHLSDSTHFGGS